MFSPFPSAIQTSQQPKLGMEKNHRILVVDDNPAIHDDFRKILSAGSKEADFDIVESALFGVSSNRRARVDFNLTYASQGQQALELVRTSVAAGCRYSVVFMDERMPPGWDGLETTVKIWEADPDLQIVICTAYSDKSWEEIADAIPYPERLLILKKPFDSIEVLQMAHALSEKWILLQSSRLNMQQLEKTVTTRTLELQNEIRKHITTGEALQHSKQQLSDFFDSASVGLMQVNGQGIVLKVNHAILQLLGYTLDECIGHPVTEFYVDEALILGGLKRLLAHESIADLEAAVRCKDGSVKYVLLDSNGLWENNEFINSRCFIRDITERKKAEAQLQQSLNEKEVLLKEIHHRVKNNLQIISSLLALRADTVAEENIREVLIESQQRIRSMSLIHEHFYQSESLARVDFGEYLLKLVNTLYRSTSSTIGGVKLDINAEENVSLNMETAVPLGLMVNELVNNAFKHAFKNGKGLLSITLKRESPDSYNLTVADDGPGLPPDFDIATTSSLGMRLVETFSRQLKAKLEIPSGVGATFRLVFSELLYADRN